MLTDKDRKTIIANAVEVALRNLNLDAEYVVRRPTPHVVQVHVGHRFFEIKVSAPWS